MAILIELCEAHASEFYDREFGKYKGSLGIVNAKEV